MRARGLLLLAALVASCGKPAPDAWLGAPQHIADGVELYGATDSSLVDPSAPIAVFLLKIDPAKARLIAAHANDEIGGLETVQHLADRHQAIAAINGGYSTAGGDPTAVLKIGGELVSDAAATKGAVIIASPEHGRTSLDFDQVAVRLSLRFKTAGRDWIVPVDGVDTTRARGKLMMYTPSYHSDTDTAPTGTEWVLRGRPLKVTEILPGAGRTPIPRDGVVLSYGGALTDGNAESLAALQPGVEVSVETAWTALNGLSADRLNEADSIVNGAGLLRVKGRVLTGWHEESLNTDAFITARHPRTLIGVDRHGTIWLAAADGRQPDQSVGMTFADLQRLCDRLDLTDALNLDGGGSTTMVVKGRVVNQPVDGKEGRAVGDAILVKAR